MSILTGKVVTFFNGRGYDGGGGKVNKVGKFAEASGVAGPLDIIFIAIFVCIINKNGEVAQ